MIQAAREQAAQLTRAAYERAAAAGVLPAGVQVNAAIEVSRDTAHGDYASSFAMAGARALRMPPRAIAQAIVERLELEGSYFNKAEIAGPGFLNFTLGPKWYGDVLSAIETQGGAYGSGDGGAGRKVLVELVSANPTGPTSLDDARGVVQGDVLSNILSREGQESRVDDARSLVTVLTQPVNLLRDGKPVKLSKAVTLHELLDEISLDAARYYLNSRPPSGPLDLDLDLAVRQDGGNPLYCVQYAHARICTLLSRMAELCPAGQADASVLTAPEELALIKSLAQYPEELRLAARNCDPSRVNRYLTVLAGGFRRFYNTCRCTADDPRLRAARRRLTDAVRVVLENGLNLLGVSAPEKM